MTSPKIVEDYTISGVNVGKIVRRIIEHAPKICLEDLKQVTIVDSNPEKRGFACYLKDEREIRIFAKELIGWQPWILKKSYLFPYITVGLALGHELDHHINRNNNEIDKERSAEENAIKYISPSFGIFKPLIKILMLLRKRNSRSG